MRGNLEMVVFDLDDTLYPEAQFVRGGIKAAGKHLDEVLGRSTNAGEVFADILVRHGFVKVFDRGLDVLGIEAGTDFIPELIKAFRAHVPVLSPWPGVPGMLKGLADRGVRLGLVSDGPLQVQRNKWAALDLGVDFDVVVFTDELGGRGTWKPAPDAFLEVQRRTGLSGASLAMVGDRPEKDFPVPDSLGWRTLRVAYPGAYHEHDPDPDRGRALARNAREISAVLMGWLGEDRRGTSARIQEE